MSLPLEPITHQPMPLMAAVLFLLVAARVGGEIMERLGQPALVGELLAGVILGPMLLDFLRPSAELRVVADLGVFFLVLLAGLEMTPADIWGAVRGRGILVALTGFLFPLILGLEVGWALGLGLQQMVFVSLCIAITALPISVRLVMDTKAGETRVGKSIVAAAVVNDIIALVILGIVLDMAQVGRLPVFIKRMGQSVAEVGLFIAVILAANRLVKWTALRLGSQAQQIVGRAVRWFRGQETLFAFAILLVLIFASVAETLGLHFLVGTFLGGILLSGELLGERNYNTVKRTTATVTMGFLAPVFFAHIGLEMSPEVWRLPGLLLLIFTAGVAGKFIGGFLGARWAGFSERDSIAVGVGLNGRGTLDLIIATIALERGMIGRELFSALVCMSISVTLLTPWCFRLVHKPQPASAGSG